MTLSVYADDLKIVGVTASMKYFHIEGKLIVEAEVKTLYVGASKITNGKFSGTYSSSALTSATVSGTVVLASSTALPISSFSTDLAVKATFESGTDGAQLKAPGISASANFDIKAGPVKINGKMQLSSYTDACQTHGGNSLDNIVIAASTADDAESSATLRAKIGTQLDIESENGGVKAAAVFTCGGEIRVTFEAPDGEVTYVTGKALRSFKLEATLVKDAAEWLVTARITGKLTGTDVSYYFNTKSLTLSSDVQTASDDSGKTAMSLTVGDTGGDCGKEGNFASGDFSFDAEVISVSGAVSGVKTCDGVYKLHTSASIDAVDFAVDAGNATENLVIKDAEVFMEGKPGSTWTVRVEGKADADFSNFGFISTFKEVSAVLSFKIAADGEATFVSKKFSIDGISKQEVAPNAFFSGSLGVVVPAPSSGELIDADNTKITAFVTVGDIAVADEAATLTCDCESRALAMKTTSTKLADILLSDKRTMKKIAFVEVTNAPGDDKWKVAVNGTLSVDDHDVPALGKVSSAAVEYTTAGKVLSTAVMVEVDVNVEHSESAGYSSSFAVSKGSKKLKFAYPCEGGGDDLDLSSLGLKLAITMGHNDLKAKDIPVSSGKYYCEIFSATTKTLEVEAEIGAGQSGVYVTGSSVDEFKVYADAYYAGNGDDGGWTIVGIVSGKIALGGAPKAYKSWGFHTGTHHFGTTKSVTFTADPRVLYKEQFNCQDPPPPPVAAEHSTNFNSADDDGWRSQCEERDVYDPYSDFTFTLEYGAPHKDRCDSLGSYVKGSVVIKYEESNVPANQKFLQHSEVRGTRACDPELQQANGLFSLGFENKTVEYVASVGLNDTETAELVAEGAITMKGVEVSLTGFLPAGITGDDLANAANDLRVVDDGEATDPGDLRWEGTVEGSSKIVHTETNETFWTQDLAAGWGIDTSKLKDLKIEVAIAFSIASGGKPPAFEDPAVTLPSVEMIIPGVKKGDKPVVHIKDGEDIPIRLPCGKPYPDDNETDSSGPIYTATGDVVVSIIAGSIEISDADATYAYDCRTATTSLHIPSTDEITAGGIDFADAQAIFKRPIDADDGSDVGMTLDIVGPVAMDVLGGKVPDLGWTDQIGTVQYEIDGGTGTFEDTTVQASFELAWESKDATSFIKIAGNAEIEYPCNKKGDTIDASEATLLFGLGENWVVDERLFASVSIVCGGTGGSADASLYVHAEGGRHTASSTFPSEKGGDGLKTLSDFHIDIQGYEGTLRGWTFAGTVSGTYVIDGADGDSVKDTFGFNTRTGEFVTSTLSNYNSALMDVSIWETDFTFCSSFGAPLAGHMRLAIKPAAAEVEGLIFGKKNCGKWIGEHADYVFVMNVPELPYVLDEGQGLFFTDAAITLRGKHPAGWAFLEDCPFLELDWSGDITGAAFIDVPVQTMFLDHSSVEATVNFDVKTKESAPDAVGETEIETELVVSKVSVASDVKLEIMDKATGETAVMLLEGDELPVAVPCGDSNMFDSKVDVTIEMPSLSLDGVKGPTLTHDCWTGGMYLTGKGSVISRFSICSTR